MDATTPQSVAWMLSRPAARLLARLAGVSCIPAASIALFWAWEFLSTGDVVVGAFFVVWALMYLAGAIGGLSAARRVATVGGSWTGAAAGAPPVSTLFIWPWLPNTSAVALASLHVIAVSLFTVAVRLERGHAHRTESDTLLTIP